jgi:hypothetical protein
MDRVLMQGIVASLYLSAFCALVVACAPAEHGEACAVSGDCAAGVICHAGLCNEGQRACANDGECSGGEVCSRGICQPTNEECGGSWDCPSEHICADGECRRPEVGNPCRRHQDCGSLMYCPEPRYECTELIGGACWTREICAEGEDCEEIDDQTGLGRCGGGPVVADCQQNQDCPASEPVCLLGACVACASDRHCDEGQTCIGNRCVEAADECVEHSDCAAGQLCENRRCVDDEPGCRSDADCVGEQQCRDGACVTVAPGGCNHDGECPDDQACQNRQCVPRGQGGNLAYGVATQAASSCQSGYAGVWNNEVFCSQPCGHGADCPLGSMCTTLLASSISFCVPGVRAQATFSSPENQPCAGAGDCRSGICANTQQGSVCQKDCRRDSHCGNNQACMAADLDGRGAIARVCGSLGGTQANGSACVVGQANTCRSGICDNTTNQCQALCCAAADCPAGLACNPTIIDRAGQHIVKVCGRPQGQGQGRVGVACQGDADCFSSSCLNNRCSDVCCNDADCNGLACRPYNVADQQNPVMVNLCQ